MLHVSATDTSKGVILAACPLQKGVAAALARAVGLHVARRVWVHTGRTIIFD